MQGKSRESNSSNMQKKQGYMACIVTHARARYLARPKAWHQRCYLQQHLKSLESPIPGGPGVYPWSFQGGYRSPEDLRGEIEIPPDPLARAERKRTAHAAAIRAKG